MRAPSEVPSPEPNVPQRSRRDSALWAIIVITVVALAVIISPLVSDKLATRLILPEQEVPRRDMEILGDVEYVRVTLNPHVASSVSTIIISNTELSNDALFATPFPDVLTVSVRPSTRLAGDNGVPMTLSDIDEGMRVRVVGQYLPAQRRVVHTKSVTFVSRTR